MWCQEDKEISVAAALMTMTTTKKTRRFPVENCRCDGPDDIWIMNWPNFETGVTVSGVAMGGRCGTSTGSRSIVGGRHCWRCRWTQFSQIMYLFCAGRMQTRGELFIPPWYASRSQRTNVETIFGVPKIGFMVPATPWPTKYQDDEHETKINSNKNKKVKRGDTKKARAILYMWIQGEEPWPKFDEMDVRDLFYAYWEIASRWQKPYYPSANADRLGMQRHE